MNREEEFLPEQAIEAFLAILKEQNKAFFWLVTILPFPASYWLLDLAPSYTPCLCLCLIPSAIHFILKMEAVMSFTTLHVVTIWNLTWNVICVFSESKNLQALMCDVNSLAKALELVHKVHIVNLCHL
jgi:hypothetical protein